MFKRFSNQQLLITLGGLLGLYVLSLLLGGSKARSFKGEVIAVDSTLVNKIIITAPNQDPYTLQKNAGQWQVELAGGGFAQTEAGTVNQALGGVQALRTIGLASNKKDQWGEFGVDEAGGVQVKMYENDKLLADVILGQTFYQQSGLMSYVRKTDEEKTYIAAGNLAQSFGKPANDWRDKKLVQGSRNDWTMLTFSYPGDSSFQLIKTPDNQWMFSDSSATNSSAVNTYLSTLGYTKGITFVEQLPAGNPIMSLAVQSLSGLPFQIAAFDDGQGGYLITSTANAGATFEGESIVGNIFSGPSKFIPEPEG